MISKKDYIKKWCELALKEVKNINTSAPSSYGLKHYCEDSIGTYVSNEEIIEVMNELGYNSRSFHRINCHYNISKIINKVIFSKRLGNQYKNDFRIFSERSSIINYDLKVDSFKFKYHLVYENDEVSETFTSNIELEEGTKFSYNGSCFEVTSKSINNILAENI
jgi:hypothetical protein